MEGPALYQVAVKNGGVSRQRAVTRKPAGKSDRRMAVWLLVVAILSSSILCVWSRAKVTAIGYEISQETRRLRNVKELNGQLRSELATLKAPGRLEPIAREELGLRPPENGQIVFMR